MSKFSALQLQLFSAFSIFGSAKELASTVRLVLTLTAWPSVVLKETIRKESKIADSRQGARGGRRARFASRGEGGIKKPLDPDAPPNARHRGAELGEKGLYVSYLVRLSLVLATKY